MDLLLTAILVTGVPTLLIVAVKLAAARVVSDNHNSDSTRFPVDLDCRHTPGDTCNSEAEDDENMYTTAPDYFTDPTYSWMEGNLFHQDDSPSRSFDNE
ncbi:MAG TPA: hypothetical protein HPP94_12815 [Desulfuromonadales bacterium]|nr:hypothetical protein [Desulfuromonadales bacterium]